MSRRRRGLLLAGLSLVLGGLAASDVGRREAALAEQIGAPVDVVVARRDLTPGTRLRPRHLAVRRIPQRYAPVGAAVSPAEVVGGRVAAAVVAGAPVSAGLLVAGAGAGAPVRPGERAVEVVAAGSPELVVPGARVDVLVTRERGGTRLALQDVEVLASREATDVADGAVRVAATLRVRLRDAVYLTAAQSFARDVRLLPRAGGDRGRAGAVAVGAGL